MGQHQMWAAQFITLQRAAPVDQLGRLGSMGFGLPVGDRRAVRVSGQAGVLHVGDGGFQMSIPGTGDARQLQLPVKIIVMNNGYLGMVRQWQELFYNNRLSSVKLDTFPRRRNCSPAPTASRAARWNARANWRRRSKKRLREPGPYLLERASARRSRTCTRWFRPVAQSMKWCWPRRSRLQVDS
ncbi:MAG: thiamine pyrophosphate-dependent enzyme [Paludibaculum sp.]